MTVKTSFKIKVCSIILFAVSRNQIGKSVLVKSPKKDNINDANVLFLAPVFPIKNNITFGSQFTIFKKWFSGDKKAIAISGNRIRCGMNSLLNNL